jgi:DNA-binding MarR family transcriptional regulator
MGKARLKNLICDVSLEVRRAFVKELNTLGLSYQQWNVMKAIKKTDEPISAKTLVEELNSDKATISGVVRRLANAGYLTEQKNPEDKREMLLYLSGDSAKLCESILELEANFHSSIFSDLSDDELEELESLLRRIKF